MNDQFDESKLNPDYPYTYLHILGGCHGIAFMGKVKIDNFYGSCDAPISQDFILENGQHPESGDQIVCSHCGQPMEFPPQLLDKELYKNIKKGRRREEKKRQKDEQR